MLCHGLVPSQDDQLLLWKGKSPCSDICVPKACEISYRVHLLQIPPPARKENFKNNKGRSYNVGGKRLDLVPVRWHSLWLSVWRKFSASASMKEREWDANLGSRPGICQFNLLLSREKKSLCTSCISHQHHFRKRGTKWEVSAWKLDTRWDDEEENNSSFSVFCTFT